MWGIVLRSRHDQSPPESQVPIETKCEGDTKIGGAKIHHKASGYDALLGEGCWVD
jgi:hypothetical protein